jgi:hypothetical protein
VLEVALTIGDAAVPVTCTSASTTADSVFTDIPAAPAFIGDATESLRACADAAPSTTSLFEDQLPCSARSPPSRARSLPSSIVRTLSAKRTATRPS